MIAEHSEVVSWPIVGGLFVVPSFPFQLATWRTRPQLCRAIAELAQSTPGPLESRERATVPAAVPIRLAVPSPGARPRPAVPTGGGRADLFPLALVHSRSW